MITNKTDNELILKIVNGDILSFETLVIRYQKRLLHFTKRIIKDEKTAEEIVQDTFLKIYKIIDQIDTHRKFSTYLFAIAKNNAISALRKQKAVFPLSENVSSGEDIYLMTEKNDLQKWLGKKIDSLEKKYQQTIRLYYFKEMSYEEISRKLSLPINTIRTHLKRGRDALKKIIEHEKKIY